MPTISILLRSDQRVFRECATRKFPSTCSSIHTRRWQPTCTIFDFCILTFGHGTHACIGRHYAKMEGKLCIEKLLSEAPDYEVHPDQLSRIQTEFVQGWETMPVTLRP